MGLVECGSRGLGGVGCGAVEVLKGPGVGVGPGVEGVERSRGWGVGRPMELVECGSMELVECGSRGLGGVGGPCGFGVAVQVVGVGGPCGVGVERVGWCWCERFHGFAVRLVISSITVICEIRKRS